MKTFRTRLPPLAAAMLLTFAGHGIARDFIDATVDQAIDEARRELHSENLSLGKTDGQPSAAISPHGDLLIDGAAVPVTPRQRELLLDHRGRIIAIAETGLEAGKEGGRIARRAIWSIPALIFGGEKAAERFERRIEAEAARVELKALAICDRLPEVLESQQRLVAELPAFVPWATMTQDDIDDCAKDRAQALARVDKMP